MGLKKGKEEGREGSKKQEGQNEGVEKYTKR